MVQVERQTELTIALGIEIVVNGAMEGRLRKVLLVEDAAPQSQWLRFLESKVAKFGEHHQLSAVALILVRRR